MAKEKLTELIFGNDSPVWKEESTRFSLMSSINFDVGGGNSLNIGLNKSRIPGVSEWHLTILITIITDDNIRDAKMYEKQLSRGQAYKLLAAFSPLMDEAKYTNRDTYAQIKTTIKNIVGDTGVEICPLWSNDKRYLVIVIKDSLNIAIPIDKFEDAWWNFVYMSGIIEEANFKTMCTNIEMIASAYDEHGVLYGKYK